jgi:hypothetical protein
MKTTQCCLRPDDNGFDDTTKTSLWQSECAAKGGIYNNVAIVSVIRYSIIRMAGYKLQLKRILVATLRAGRCQEIAF